MPETIEINERPLSPEEIQRDYVNIKAAGQILRDCSETTARRRIKLYETGTQRKIATITEVVNGGVVKLYPRKDIEAVAAHFNIIPSVIRYETVSVPQEAAAVPHRVPHLEPSKGVVSQGIGESGDKRREVVIGIQDTPVFRKTVIYTAFSTLAIGLLLSIGLLFIVNRMVNKLNTGIEALRQEYRDSRLIDQIEKEQKFFGKLD